MSFSITQSKSLSTDEIYKILKNDEFANENFKKVVPFDCLPSRPDYPSSFVVNTDPKGQKGEHWLAIYYDKSGECTFFDSFGNGPNFFGLEKYINRTSTKCDFNKMQIQSIFSNTCGYYCIYFLLLKSRGFSLKQIQNLFSKTNFNMNDYLISNIYK